MSEGKKTVDAIRLGITYGKLSKLSVVDSKNFGLLASTQTQARNQVHDEEDDASSTESIGETSNRVGNLVAELDPVVVDPSTGNRGVAIEVRNVITAKKQSVRIP